VSDGDEETTLSETSEPTIDWATAPQQFREAFERNQQTLQQERDRAARADQLERENAMLRAGVDPNHPAAEVFTNGYTGKLDVEDVKEAWAKIAGQPAPTPETPPVNADGSDPNVVAALSDLQANRNQLGNQGVIPGDEPTADPQTEMIQGFHADQKRGRTREQAMHLGIDRLFTRAAEGDERVVSNGSSGASAAQQSVQKWREKQGFE
jgi:hypothetical protein